MYNIRECYIECRTAYSSSSSTPADSGAGVDFFLLLKSDMARVMDGSLAFSSLNTLKSSVEILKLVSEFAGRCLRAQRK